jgi:hypothetical protein
MVRLGGTANLGKVSKRFYKIRRESTKSSMRIAIFLIIERRQSKRFERYAHTEEILRAWMADGGEKKTLRRSAQRNGR